MSFTHKNELNFHGKQNLKKWNDWEGNWNSYLRYLDENKVISTNFIYEVGQYRLRDGYVPPWELKDFK